MVVELKGEMFLLDTRTKQLEPLGDDGLKLSNGQYKPSVKALAKKKYFEGYPLPAIEDEVGIPRPTLQKWAYGRKEDCSDPKCWKAERDRYFRDIADKNANAVHMIDGDLLFKLRHFFENANVPTTAEEARVWAEIRDKLLRSNSFGKATTGQPGATGGKLSLTLNQQINAGAQPLSRDEAIKVINSDIAFEDDQEPDPPYDDAA